MKKTGTSKKSETKNNRLHSADFTSPDVDLTDAMKGKFNDFLEEIKKQSETAKR